MRYAHILHEVYDRPWLLRADVHHRIQQLVKLKLEMSRQDFVMRDRVIEVCGDKVTLDSMTVSNGVARIPFAGVLVKGAGDWEKYAGALAHSDVTVDIEEALENPKVGAIMFDVDSPGGTCAGSFELADLVAEANKVKPCLAWVEGLCCSAAFLSMSGCDLIYGSLTSELGAIECYLPFVDVSAAYKKEGYERDIIKPDQSVHAAAGYPGTSLTEEQREYMKAQVTDLLKMYVDHLGEVRPAIPEDAMDGRSFFGHRAVEKGLMDAVTSKTQAVADLRKWAGLPKLDSVK